MMTTSIKHCPKCLRNRTMDVKRALIDEKEPVWIAVCPVCGGKITFSFETAKNLEQQYQEDRETKQYTSTYTLESAFKLAEELKKQNTTIPKETRSNEKPTNNPDADFELAEKYTRRHSGKKNSPEYVTIRPDGCLAFGKKVAELLGNQPKWVSIRINRKTNQINIRKGEVGERSITYNKSGGARTGIKNIITSVGVLTGIYEIDEIDTSRGITFTYRVKPE